MKFIRLLLFIPISILSIFISGIIVGFIFDLFNYIDNDTDLLSSIWQSIVKGGLIFYFSVLIGIKIFPYEKKKYALIILTILMFGFYWVIYEILKSNSRLNTYYNLPKELMVKSAISVISLGIGELISILMLWKVYFFDEKH